MLPKKNYFVDKRQEDIRNFFDFIRSMVKETDDIKFIIARYSFKYGFTRKTLREYYNILLDAELIKEKSKDLIDKVF